MKKNIYIGDIHGRTVWKQIVEEHFDADNIVFIADYLDSYDVSPIIQLHNLKEIIQFKKENKSKVHLLVGNHDIHYWRGNKDNGITAGFQPGMRYQFEFVFEENKDLFNMAILIDNKLCTHAGVSEDFLKQVNFWSEENCKLNDIPNFLNDLFKYKINEFLFNSYRNREGNNFIANPYGFDVWQTPIWIRPLSLQRSNKKSDLKKEFIQIVGHTPQDSIDIKGKTTGGKYYYIDTLEVGQYLIEEDGVFKIGYIK